MPAEAHFFKYVIKREEQSSDSFIYCFDTQFNLCAKLNFTGL